MSAEPVQPAEEVDGRDLARRYSTAWKGPDGKKLTAQQRAVLKQVAGGQHVWVSSREPYGPSLASLSTVRTLVARGLVEWDPQAPGSVWAVGSTARRELQLAAERAQAAAERQARIDKLAAAPREVLVGLLFDTAQEVTWLREALRAHAQHR